MSKQKTTSPSTPSFAQERDLGALRQRDPELKIRWDESLNAPALMTGKLAEPFRGISQKVVEQAALEFLEENRSLFRMDDPKRELGLINKVTDSAGNICVAMQQKHKGIPVNGGTIRVQFAADKTVNRVANKYVPDIDLDTEPKIDIDAALKAALDDAGEGNVDSTHTPTLAIIRHDGSFYLAWDISIDDREHSRLMRYYIDAQTGNVIFSYNDLRYSGTGYYSGSGVLNSTASGTTFKLIDSSRTATGGPELRTCDLDGSASGNADAGNISEDNNDNWNTASTTPRKSHQGAEVDIHRYIAETVDYYRTVHGWNSYDNAGSTVYCGVHLGVDYNNAYYYPSQKKFYFGDGDNSTFDYLTAKDVVAHEFTHAVTDHTSNLDYFNQPGGLNEAFSDIFAAFIDSDDSDIGEECTTPGFPGDCLRRMSNPSDPGALARIPNHVSAALDTMSTGYFDGQDPHEACGPMIYAAYFMIYGGTHPNSGISVTALGRHVVEKIMFHVQSVGLLGNNSATFLECREAALNAAQSLYSTDPAYLQILDSIKNAYTAVGIGPDIYVRDSLSDIGTIPSIGTLWRSPDIITRTAQVSDPASTLGDMTKDDLAENVEQGQDNYVYVRLQNRGIAAGSVTINLYWSDPSTFSSPASWHTIGSAYLSSVAPGVVTIAELVWHSADIPPLGHFCIVAELDDPLDPAPDKSLITTGALFNKFIAESNNYAWKNISVVDVLPMGLTELTFIARRGGSGEISDIQFNVEQLPVGTACWIRLLRHLCDGCQMIGMQFDRSNTRYAYYKLTTGTICSMNNVTFDDIEETAVHFYVKAPDQASRSYEIAVSQNVNGRLTGTVTHVLNVCTAGDFEFIGNKNTQEVHKKGCKWIEKTSRGNMVGFRTLSHAHQEGLDNCAYCIGDSKR